MDESATVDIHGGVEVEGEVGSGARDAEQKITFLRRDKIGEGPIRYLSGIPMMLPCQGRVGSSSIFGRELQLYCASFNSNSRY